MEGEVVQLSGRAIKAASKNILTTTSWGFQVRRYKLSTIHVLRSIFLPCKSPDFFIAFPVTLFRTCYFFVCQGVQLARYFWKTSDTCLSSNQSPRLGSELSSGAI